MLILKLRSCILQTCKACPFDKRLTGARNYAPNPYSIAQARSWPSWALKIDQGLMIGHTCRASRAGWLDACFKPTILTGLIAEDIHHVCALWTSALGCDDRLLMQTFAYIFENDRWNFVLLWPSPWAEDDLLMCITHLSYMICQICMQRLSHIQQHFRYRHNLSDLTAFCEGSLALSNTEHQSQTASFSRLRYLCWLCSRASIDRATL